MHKSRNTKIVQFLQGDLTSVSSFKGEVYPVVVLENAMASEQKMISLMSSSGRISYSSANFLRFWKPDFIGDSSVFGSKDRIQGRMRQFSKDMMKIFEEKKKDFSEATDELFSKKKDLYEEDLFASVFGRNETEFFTEGRFAVHKFLYEGMGDWIKDGQWSLTEDSSGPYVKRSTRELELIMESSNALNTTKRDLEDFRKRVHECLKTKSKFVPVNRLDQLMIESLKRFSEEFYVNALAVKSPFKSIVSEALMGVAIVDSQAQAAQLYNRLIESNVNELSKPFKNSFLSHEKHLNAYQGYRISSFNEHVMKEIHDFGDLPVYCIDPQGTVEVDDGISFEMLADNKVRLHVHVADPSDFVDPKLELEAQKRAESVYLPELKIPMLPESVIKESTLSRPSIATLSFSCCFDLEGGRVSDPIIRRGVISNLIHLTYEDAENDSRLQLLKAVSEAHLKYRKSQGHFDFSFPRGIASLDHESGKISVEIEDSNGENSMKKCVAEAMIIAGRLAGEHLANHNICGPFRSHQVDPESRSLFRDSMSLVEKYELLKCFPPSSIEAHPKGHESMGLKAYVKVTSPLRRYLDLVTHKILKDNFNHRSSYSLTWFNENLHSIRRREVYNKRLSNAVNRFWVEKYIWQEDPLDGQVTWKLIPLERIKDSLWTVHIDQVASNFIVNLESTKSIEIGEPIKCRIKGKPHESILKFERIF